MDHSALLPTGKPHHTHHIARIGLWLIGVAVVAYSVITLGYAVGRWNGTTAQRIARYIPTPLGYYHGTIIWQRDVLAMATGMRQFATVAVNGGAGLAAPKGDATVVGYSTLLRSIAAAKYLKERGGSISDADIQQAFTAQLSQSGNEQQVADYTRHLYNWTPEQYKTYITTADVTRNALQASIIADETISAPQRQQATLVAQLIHDKKISFADAVKKYSEDAYAVQNGEIGWVGRDEIVEEMEDAAFRLKVGEVSDVIVSPYGFHIVQVTEQRQVSGALQVHLYAIFIKGPDVDQTISAQLRQHRPIILERGLRWDAETGRVAER
jgi:hypothetical protein